MANTANLTFRVTEERPLFYEEIDANFRELETLIQEFNVVDSSIDQIQTDIQNLQSTSGLSYEGNYDVATTYVRGAVVTYTDGLDYISVTDDNLGVQPGTDTDSWITLTAKSIAEFVSYDNSTSGLTATDVQAAIDEVQAAIDQLTTDLSNISNNKLSDFEAQEYDVRTANFTAVASGWYGLDVSGGGFTITLNASPTTGDVINFLLTDGDATANALTVARNGQTIEEIAEDMTVNTNSPRAFSLYYNGTTWRVFT